MRTIGLILLVLAVLTTPTLAVRDEVGDGRWFTLYTGDDKVLLRTGIFIQVGDRFLDSDNSLYQVYKVDEERLLAWARLVEDEGSLAAETQGLPGADNRKVAIYHTHSGESYEPSEGTASTDKVPGGVYGVGSELTNRLERDGEVEVTHSERTFFPYEGAYRRSRTEAINLVEQGDLDAIFDLHRDAAPKEEYYREIDDEMHLTQVMIVVGKQNPLNQTNEEFAWQLKEVADSMYPELVKGIFYAQGGYNQDLHPRGLLLEVGAHTNSRVEAEVGARAFADVIYVTLYGPLPRTSEVEQEIEDNRQLQPTADQRPGRSGGVFRGLFALVGLLGLGGTFYLFLSTGSWQGVKDTLSHFFRVEFKDLVSAVPWQKLHPRYIFGQLREIKAGADAPPGLRYFLEWFRDLFKPRNKV